MSLESTWPTAVDYTGAAQDPEHCFVDPRLQRALFRQNSMGMPVVRSGQMAAVFPVEIDGEPCALRLFTTPTDHSARYRAVNAHLASRPGVPLAPAEWIDEAVAVGTGTFPAVLMPWVDGMLLSSYVDEMVEEGRAAELRQLADAWVHLASSLRAASVVHGDLQHGNVMVGSDGALRLIDYDGVWVPGMPTALEEAGQPNYQHPQRMEVPEVLVEADTFAAFVIYVSLLAVAADPGLWDTFHSGENLILVREDFLEVGRRGSAAWSALAASPDPAVVAHTETLTRLCSTDLRTLPPLHDLVAGGTETVHAVPSYVPDRAGHRSGGTWWDGEDQQLQEPQPAPVAVGTGGPGQAAWNVPAFAHSTPPVTPVSAQGTVPSSGGAAARIAIGLMVLAILVLFTALVIYLTSR